MKKAVLLTWLIAGLLSCFALGISTGHKAGHQQGLAQAIVKIDYCTRQGASGYYNTDKEIRCIYD